VFEYIEMFYNPVRRHGHTDRLSPIEFDGATQSGSTVSREVGAIHPAASL
jgi:hypothetical protein